MSLYVDELFGQISQLPDADREDAIVRGCKGDASVEAEVRALLSAEDDGGGAPVVIEAGAALGRYRLEEAIGEGSTASVWKAWDTHLETWTALKLLHPGGRMRGDRALEAVLHEARAASGIISDHVVQIKTAGRFVGGPHFIEMELCAEHRADAAGQEHLTVGQTLSEAQLDSVREKVRVVAEAARGVDAAHRAGVLHRDLKPGNILLTPVGRRAKVTDFGLAAQQLYPSPDGATPPDRTVTVLLEAPGGTIVGTPAYMPPEQSYGHPPTRASDVYALGATLYALLADASPYQAEEGHPIPALSVLKQVRDGPPRPLRSVARVPRRLAAIVNKAMARSARDRYPTTAALAQDLERWRDGRSTSVDGRAPMLRAALFVARHRGVVGTAAVLVATVLLFAGAVGWLEVQRRSLLDAIEMSRSELEHSRSMAVRAGQVRAVAEQERNTALDEVAAAEQARVSALEGESNAERRWRNELAARREADTIREAAEAAALEAETALAASTVALQLATIAQAEAEVALQTASAQLEDEVASRDLAEAAVREARVALNDAELQVRELIDEVASQASARAAAEAERDELLLVLSRARDAIGVPQDEPPDPATLSAGEN